MTSQNTAEVAPEIYDAAHYGDTYQVDTILLKCPSCVAHGRSGILQTLKRWDVRLRVSTVGRSLDALHIADIPIACRQCKMIVVFVLSLMPPHIKIPRGETVDKAAVS
jgi:hypothetical protein